MLHQYEASCTIKLKLEVTLHYLAIGDFFQKFGVSFLDPKNHHQLNHATDLHCCIQRPGQVYQGK
jgi:hypothetical protein